MYVKNFRLTIYGQIITGALDIALIGDSGQAKSMQKIILNKVLDGKFEIISCGTASRTGITYAIDTYRGHRFIRPGVLMKSHGGTVVIDEIQHMEAKELKRLRSVRSDGLLRVDRIISGEYPCRVRLCMMGNSKSGRSGIISSTIDLNVSHSFSDQ
ncbi:MAG: hypothetical protein DRN81_01335 [Thermoproteota archaeon]|nr:MAG: hypothetical protein DRN81_01335 [Candidatus Korarchaeota archaeon]